MRSALLSATVSAALLCVSCTPERRPEPPAATPSHESQRAAGALTLVVAAPWAPLDPYAPRATPLTWALARPVYRSLFTLDPSGEPVADAAASVEERGDGVLIRLDRGVEPADVVASARRARFPSGFVGLRVRRAGRRAVRISGRAEDWRRRLARGTWILPGGRPAPQAGGAFRRVRVRPGLGASLVARPGAGAALRRLRIRVATGTDLSLRLLREGRADVAWVPWTVNLEDRAAHAGLEVAAAAGWESIDLDASAAALAPAEVRWLAGRAASRRIAEGLVRDGGEPARRPRGEAHPPSAVLLAAPTTDELLVFIARAVQRDLTRHGVAAEAVVIAAGDPVPPGAVELTRTVAAPGAPRPPGHVRLFRVASALLWRRGVTGAIPNPTLDGPLWNLARWRKAGRL